MEQKKPKLRKLDTTLPTKCDICYDKIQLYEPWYSVMITGHFCNDPKMKELGKGYMALCPGCFNAYKHFIIETRTEENHKRNLKDIKNV